MDFNVKNLVLCVFLGVILTNCARESDSAGSLLSDEILREHVSYFNQMEEEGIVNHISNAESADWLSNNVPLFEAPDSTIEQIYYFRWWTFRKHIKQTPAGFVLTEFIRPVGHDGNFNTISSALGHHLYEGRWLTDPSYMDQYTNFWLIWEDYAEDADLHKYSQWTADAIYKRYLVNKDQGFVTALLNELDKDYLQWKREKQLPNEMYWQYDVRDAMEESISGSRTDKNARPTINSYMYGNAKAIAKIAGMIGIDSLQSVYTQRAERLKQQVHENLWDAEESFFKVLHPNGKLDGAREAIGFIPWYFGLPEDSATYGKAWQQLRDPEGFDAPMGLTTAERRHPEFRTAGVGTSEWDGAVWPFATTQTLKGLARLLKYYENHDMTEHDFFDELKTYAGAHEKYGRPYIGEYHDEVNGKWLHGDNPRSIYYNHSGFADLIISDLVGIRPRADETLEVKPLIPEGEWDWFALDNVNYHGRELTIAWDRDGSKYNRGPGFQIWVDGERIHQSESIESVNVPLPASGM
ncbi:hypothetical protein NC796_12385 [Aliifodinibius sp. S!AR15-10]|uniref:MGH1-like glycoside hydrolase domain-containing protein n=1 Tax=Aliifodinibius sp. S!AR15-10 TaxID=2950437 RepID=UPI0028591DCE|nr:glycosyl hydrolase family 65 protein [Aliifodinibius sp. S!AR15-10]MDR8391947.1 hypothetical protein [Aliifodinibius sp. S!AR15-10]